MAGNVCPRLLLGNCTTGGFANRALSGPSPSLQETNPGQVEIVAQQKKMEELVEKAKELIRPVGTRERPAKTCADLHLDHPKLPSGNPHNTSIPWDANMPGRRGRARVCQGGGGPVCQGRRGATMPGGTRVCQGGLALYRSVLHWPVFLVPLDSHYIDRCFTDRFVGPFRLVLHRSQRGFQNGRHQSLLRLQDELLVHQAQASQGLMIPP